MCLHCQEVKRKKDKTQRWPFFEDGNSTCESQAPSTPRVGMGRPTTSRSLRPRPSQLGDLVELLPHPQPKKKMNLGQGPCRRGPPNKINKKKKEERNLVKGLFN